MRWYLFLLCLETHIIDVSTLLMKNRHSNVPLLVYHVPYSFMMGKINSLLQEEFLINVI